jgi:GMP synthase (glutamine-hydrolysing)
MTKLILDAPKPVAIAIRHLAFEDLGIWEPVLCESHSVQILDAGVVALNTVEVREADLVVVLGGPISAKDERKYPFLTDELQLIEYRIRHRRRTLGVCLGAQMIARALGAQVRPMKLKEIGFSELDLSQAGEASALRHLGGQPVLHWHGDQFDIPMGARLLASSSQCPNQAFSWGEAVLGLQFHLEADLGTIERWLIGHAVELAHDHVEIGLLRSLAKQHQTSLSESGQNVLRTWLQATSDQQGEMA